MNKEFGALALADFPRSVDRFALVRVHRRGALTTRGHNSPAARMGHYMLISFGHFYFLSEAVQ
jgi:hypothetical protein